METWTIDNFPQEKQLNPEVREKAIEIANELSNKGVYDKEDIVKISVKQAEEWFFESEG